MLSVIIPAYNESSVIRDCLQSLAEQSYRDPLEIIVAANGCKDDTVAIAETFRDTFAGKKYTYQILNIERGNKANALNCADRMALYPARLYLDADVICAPNLIEQVIAQLDCSAPTYVSGTLEINQGRSRISHGYGRIWKETPYIRHTVPGCGCYAVNAAGRALWDTFPAIHSDDKFVRLLFAHSDRHQVAAKYYWPLPQGFLTLWNIRTRWIRGNIQLSKVYPDLSVNDSSKFSLDKDFVVALLKHPLSSVIFFSIYSLAALRAYLLPGKGQVYWSRAR